MSMKLNAGEVGRKDLFYISPEHIVVRDSQNGRWQPHDDVEINKLVKSFEEFGQLQAVQVRRIQDNKVELVMGYRRVNAALKYNTLHPDKPMKIKAEATSLNDEEAFQRNIVENRERSETGAMDDAVNQRRLRDDFGWVDTRIAEFYHNTQSYVSQLKKLLLLTTEIQNKVHSRELSLQAALALADLPEAEQTEVATDTDSKTVIKKVRQKKINQGKKQARSLAEVKEYFRGLTGPAENPKVKDLAEYVLQFVGGGITEDDMTAKVNGLFTLPSPVSVVESTVVPEPVVSVVLETLPEPADEVGVFEPIPEFEANVPAIAA